MSCLGITLYGNKDIFCAYVCGLYMGRDESRFCNTSCDLLSDTEYKTIKLYHCVYFLFCKRNLGIDRVTDTIFFCIQPRLWVFTTTRHPVKFLDEGKAWSHDALELCSRRSLWPSMTTRQSVSKILGGG